MSLWRSLPTLDELNSLGAGTLAQRLGIVFTEIGEDFLRADMPVDSRTRQPHGILHGGASVALAESIGSVGANLCVDTARYYCLGQDINANHVRAARDGWVRGTGRALHVGRRSHVWAIEITNAAGLLICVSRLTMAVIERAPPHEVKSR